MSENIDVKAVLSAHDEASPVIKSLIRQVQRLEKLTARANDPAKMYGKLTGSAAIAGKTAHAHERQAAALRAGLNSERARLQMGGELRKRLSFESRMARQRQGEERRSRREAETALRNERVAKTKLARLSIQEAARAERRRYAEVRARLNFQSRMSAQRAAEVRAEERSTTRREAAHRRQIGLIERESRARGRAFASTGRTATSALRDAGTGVAVGAITGAAASGLAGRRIVQNETETDAAEIDARIYADLDRKGARELRDSWASKVGVDLGASTATMLATYVDSIKAGIPVNDAKSFSELSLKLSEAYGVSVEDANQVMGLVKNLQTGDGSQFSMNNMNSWANTLHALARQQNTTPQQLLEFTRQGAGGAAVLGMSQESALAFGSASTSAGNRPGESGRLLDYIASRTAGMSRQTQQQGLEGDRARKLMRVLGYGSAANMEKIRKNSPDDFVFDMLERLGKIKNEVQRNEAMLSLFGREWMGEGGRLVKKIGVVREARQIQKDAANVDEIGNLWAEHTKKIGFALKQASAALGVLLGEAGKTLGPMVATAARYFTGWAAKNRKQLQINFWAGVKGLVEGLLGREGSFSDLLDAAFGKSGLTSDPDKFYRFFKGFGDGLREFWSVLKWIGAAVWGFVTGLGKLAGVDMSDAENIGKAAAELLGVAVAAKAVERPISIVKDALVGIAAAVYAGATGLRALGALGTAGAAAGAAGAVSLPILLGVAVVGGALAVAIMNWDAIRDGANGGIRSLGDWERQKLGRFGDWLGLGSAAPAAPAGVAPMSSTGADRITGAALGRNIAAGPLDQAGLLGAIQKAEGTAGGNPYNAVLGNGRYGMPSKPLTSMTLDEVQQFGNEVRRKHGKSSALGAYQVVNVTRREAAKALGMDPKTTLYDQATQDKIALWVHQKQGLGAWKGFEKNPDALAAARAAEGPTANPASLTGAAAAVDQMARFEGLTERGAGRGTLNTFMAKNAKQIDAARTAWCANFVNASLASVGLKGTNNMTASLFRSWGVGVSPVDVAKGDVLVEHRNVQPGSPGAHVGMATGNTRQGKRGLEVEMISGNSGRAGAVERTWEKASKLDIRRAAGQVPAPTAQSLAATVPGPSTANPVSYRGDGGMGGGGGLTVTNHIVLQGSDLKPNDVARAVEESMSRRQRFVTDDTEYDV